MTQDDEAFLKRLLATFRLEAQEHLGTMSDLALRLEQGLPPDGARAAVEALFREAHSLKGAARSVNLADIESVCQSLERVLSACKRGELSASPALFDTLHAALDGLNHLLAQHMDGQPGSASGVGPALSRRLLALLSPPAAGAQPPVAMPPAPLPAIQAAEVQGAPAADTVRIATAKLDVLMTQAEELQAVKFAQAHLADELRAAGDALAEWRRQWDKRARASRQLRRARGASPGDALPRSRRQLARLLEGFDGDALALKALADRLAQLDRMAAQQRRVLSGRVDRLLDDMKQALMLPVSTLLSPLPRLVRDLAHDSGKEVELVVHGATLDIDRRILEQMKTPLLHLVRNAVDHGIEPPAQRLQAGKPARGRIGIDVSPREGNRIEIVLADDGAGVAFDKVRAKAEKMGLATPQALAAMRPPELAGLLFESGLSTSAMLTDLSGHGIGLAIVREKVEGLGGSIAAELPGTGKGMAFRIVLPTTLATFRGVLVRLGERVFVLPSRHVERVARIAHAAVRATAQGAAVELEGAQVPLASLAAVLELPAPASGGGSHLQLVVLAGGDRQVAFSVDEVIADEEVLVKPLVSPLRRVRHIAGATVLGAGRVVPLLNVADLIKTALHGPATPASTPGDDEAASLLVAEDSVTTRTALQAMLEAAGFRVTTAADGMEALAQLQRDDFDLLVSDVEMPRLDGFGLTAQLRRDHRLAALPVILITALDSSEDRRRGSEVGANAYIVKSGFDRRRLVDTIRSLL